MAAAACAAAAAVQRAQILIQATKKDTTEPDINGDSNDKEPLETQQSSSSPPVSESTKDQAPIEECESGSGATAAKKDLKTKEDDLSAGNSVEIAEVSGERDDVSAATELDDDGCSKSAAGLTASQAACTAAADTGERVRENPCVVEGSNIGDSSLVESSSKEQVCQNNSNSSSHSADLRNAAPLLKEIIQGKLALAAAASLASRHQPDHPIVNMDLAAANRDFARHNNNDLKDPNNPVVGQNEVNAKGQAEFMQHFLKMHQMLSLNNRAQPPMPKPVQPVDSDPEEDCKIEDDLEEEEEEELPIDLHGGASDTDALSGKSQTSPRSPSSDAGLSTSSADKADKASRLESLVTSLQRASPSLPGGKENGKDASGANPPVNGCKKRKLYQPVQAKISDDDNIMNSEAGLDQQPDAKRSREPSANDENADPKSGINGELTPNLPTGLPPTGLPGNNNLLPNNLPVQMHYMEMARKFLQDQQDKATKEAITKEILADTVGKNNDMAEKLVSISPELKGLADLLKSEITASLALIIDSIVGRFLQHTRNNNSTAAASIRPPLAGMKHTSPFVSGGGVDPTDSPTSLLPPMPNLKTNNMTPSGRAPQVRDRSAPRSTGIGPVSMYNPTTPKITSAITTIPTSSAFPLPPTLRPAPGLLQQAPSMPPQPASTTSSSLNNNHSEDEHHSSPSPVGRDLSPPEQDEALSLVVTPKKRRHKVTDTRITPRTLSRVLGEPLAELHKQFPNFQGFKGTNTDGGNPGGIAAAGSPRLPVPHPLFPGLPAPPGLLAGLPTSVAIPNPSLADFNPFSSFYSPPHLPVSSSAGTPTGLPPSAVRDNKLKLMSSTPPLDKSRQVLQSRERHHSSSDLGRDEGTTPPSLLRHPSLLSRGSPDFAARLRDDRERDQEDFDRMGQSMGFMSGKS